MNEHLTKTLIRSTTRRTIVRTGAKVAYAAPLVAVSYKLSQVGAMGASVVCSGVNFTCTGDRALPCGNGGSFGFCFCDQGAGGGYTCVADVFCAGSRSCTSDAQCGAGFICSANCCGQICIPLCDAPVVRDDSDPSEGRASGIS